MPSKHVLLFAHDRVPFAAVHDLNVRSKLRRRLQTFLAAASTVVQRQASALDGLERANIGSFEDLVELAETQGAQARGSIAADLVLLTTVQIGQLLVLAEDQPSLLSEDGAVPMAFGTGLLAAGVAAAATTADEIITLGLEAVAVAFRLGLVLQRRARDIEDSQGAWARVVSGTADLEQGLESFNASLRPMNRVYIGQVLSDRIVVFGPPSTLDAFAKTTATVTPPATTFTQAPLHGAHLPSINASEVVGSAPAQVAEVWKLAVDQIAHKPINVEEIAAALVTDLQKTNSTDVTLTSFGESSEASGIAALLEENGVAVEVSQLGATPKPYGDDVNNIPADAIAVVGMSGRFPDSDTLDEFWRLLETATTTHQVIPQSRFTVDDFYDPTREKHNALLARFGCFLKNPGDFDHRLFNISPREAMQMDPVQRMLLMTTYEALEMAGYSPPTPSAPGDSEQAPPRIATYFGQTIDDWKSINDQQGIDTHYLPGVNRGFAPGRLSHFFQWAGGFYSIDTGCSSSATALCLARDALTAGKYDAAVVGGGTLLTAPEWFAGLSQGGFLSPTGACKTYSDQADGYCRGEGVGVVILKRLADAVRSKDNVIAVIAGASRNCNAGAGSITYPGEKAQGALYRRVMRQAAVLPGQVDVVEMHGTGTQAGDRVETTAVQSVFAPTNAPQREKPLIVGALKANIGHSEAAAGIISVMKAILILQHSKIPTQPNQHMKLNPYLEPLIGKQIQLANGQSWTRNGSEPRYIFVNNFDAAGGNVSMLLQDPPAFAVPSPVSQSDARTHHVVVTSGRTATAHEANRKRLRAYLTAHPDTNLADLAYTTTARRIHNVSRDAYAVSSTADLLRQLEKPLNDKIDSAAPSAVVFAFTGQGAQSLGMGGALYNTSPTFRRQLDSLQEICDAQGLPTKFINAIRGGSDGASVTEVDMQVATVALEIALARYWQALGVRPTVLIGHSLGEYAALCVAGVLSTSDALALAFRRATLIFSRCPPSEAGMLAVGLPMRTVQYRIRDSAATAGCEVCCVNGPSSTVVGGPVAAIEALDEYLKSDGKVSTTRLRVQHAFHTRQMDVLLDELESSAAQVPFHAPTLPVASTVLGRIVKPGEVGVFDANYLRRHTREPVAFLDAVRVCEAEGLVADRSFAVEIGPHPICIGLMAACLQSTSINAWPSLRRGGDDWQSISGAVAAAHRAQLPVAWSEFHKDHLDSVRLLSDLPTYAFDLKTFWHSYKTPTAAAAVTAAAPSRSSRLASTTLHSVEKLNKDGDLLTGTFTVHLPDPKLAKAIGGHVVDESAICPASIFIDMAYTAAAYLEQEHGSAASLSTYELTSLEMHSPLVLREDMEVLPEVWVDAALNTKTNTVSVQFKGRKGTTPVEYGSAMMLLGQNDASVRRDWSRIQPLINARVQTLNTSTRPREVHAMDTLLFYKVFSEIVDYATPYHAVQEAMIAANFRDASITLQLPATGDLGTFISSPFAVDALVHVAGFLLNADVRRPKNEVHIANHIGSLRIVGDLSSPGPYHAYATIREQDPKSGVSFCDVYATDAEGQLVALCTDICFKKLERDFFALLTGATRGRSSKPAPTAPVKAMPKRARQPAPSPSPSSSSGSNTPMSRSATPSSVSDTVDLCTELLEAVAERTGVSVAEMKAAPGTTFTDFGVDSQMAIAILATFQRTTAVELPAAFFSNFPTPADVELELGDSPADFEETKPSPVSTPAKAPTPVRKQGPTPSNTLLALVSDALGLEASDLTPSTTFESVGMDSMLSIKITAAFQGETGIELPAAFFTQNPTVGAAVEDLDGGEEESAPVTTVAVSAPAKETTADSARQRKLDSAVSRAVLIQGKSRSQEAPLFLTTDGSGTVESYIHLKALPKGRRIYALESPFLEQPEHFDLSIEEMATIFLRTIRRIQPQGPYLIGGWSAGSMYAYEVAHRLTREGETVDALIILDMRAPSLIPTSIVTTDFVNKLGTFEGINRARDLPEDLSVKERDHLMATCRALSRYDAPAFPKGREPKQVAVVWALLGLDNRQDAPPACMCRPGVELGKTLYEMNLDEFEHYFNSWFYGRRETFGMNGWEDFVGEHIAVHTVNGDHFSMMCPPFASEVGDIVVDTVTRAVGE
ncbi:Orsellinic acid synthase [Aspergillus mulundensis]|uniref:Orsellinic acid synthase n=1 Tax=Aspergillus mulundensis TaxID=1810919 RepID=A0A3D8T3W3_9EURO|nr:Orsellinic acid synthase [Aspergillus mulundensis]RDW92688.1 Orsellinic acid synthase [Aspergillus mulundensis]